MSNETNQTNPVDSEQPTNQRIIHNLTQQLAEAKKELELLKRHGKWTYCKVHKTIHFVIKETSCPLCLQEKLDDTFSGMGKLQIQLDKAEERNIQWAVESKKVCQELVEVQVKLETVEMDNEIRARKIAADMMQPALKAWKADNNKLREFIEELSFQSCCSWCEKNMKMQIQILKEK